MKKRENVMHMSIESVTVESIMTKDVKTAKADQTVNAVASIMNENNIGSVVITERKNTPAGIITERDIVRISGTTEILILHLFARDIMSKPVITINARSSVKDAIQTMQLKNIRRLPVINSEKRMMVGIVTDSDIFRAIMKSQSLLTTVSESIVIEQYKPVYERLSEFMLGEMLLPTTNANQ
jgi:CBS domain-containing protein